jgi:hypothetical protein
MKEVFSRNGGTPMINCKDKIKLYNMNYIEESVVFRLY